MNFMTSFMDRYCMSYGIIAVEDIIQESFIKVITSKPNFETESKMGMAPCRRQNSTMNYLRKIKIP